MWKYLVLCVVLAACLPAGGEFASQATGLSGRTGPQTVISTHPHHVLYGHLLLVTQGQRTVNALIISHRRDGVHRLRPREAWQDGHRLPFRRLDRRLGCTQGDCRNDALGMIALSEEMLARAAREGFDARLIGPQGAIDIHAPPALFHIGATSGQQSHAP